MKKQFTMIKACAVCGKKYGEVKTDVDPGEHNITHGYCKKCAEIAMCPMNVFASQEYEGLFVVETENRIFAFDQFGFVEIDDMLNFEIKDVPIYSYSVFPEYFLENLYEIARAVK